MIETFKSYLRSNPRIHDALKRAKRTVGFRSDPAYDFFCCYTRAHPGPIRLLQIGANDGMRNDPFREFIVRGWRGILVEPIPRAYALLRKNYAHLNRQLVLVNAAITRNDGSMTLYTFDEDFLESLPLEQRLDYLRKVSVDRKHVEHYVTAHERSTIIETQVPCLSIPSVLQRHWADDCIDLLAIDAEGHEPEILHSIDFDGFKPDTIFYESHTLQPSIAAELELYLQSRGYQTFRLLGDSVAMLPEILARCRTQRRWPLA